MDARKKANSDRLANAGKGSFDPKMPYEGTMSRDETLRVRGYRLVDGKWVP